MRTVFSSFLWAGLLIDQTGHAADVNVAVAANFTGPMEKVTPAFEKATGHKVVIAHGTDGCHWIVLPSLYPTLRQDVAVLLRGKENPAAGALLAFLKSDTARRVIRPHSYEL